MTKPVEIDFSDLLSFPPTSTELWVQSSVKQKILQTLPYRVGEPMRIALGTERVVVIGGGTLIDNAKAWRADNSPQTQLVAVPSLWGSGAEVSPIVVINRNGSKSIRIGEQFLPDQIAYWPELVDSLPETLARAACGDCWTHAVEGFLSPLADSELREDIAQLIQEMLDAPLGKSPLWFRFSARACRAQVRSSVGLVHGIAHTLEGPLAARPEPHAWAHSALCSLYLLPVMAYNTASDGKTNRLLAEHDIPLNAIFRIAKQLYDHHSYQQALPVLVKNWQHVVRDRSSRTNIRLVRPRDLEFFELWRDV